MSLTSLYTGISGLNASGTALSVTGDNIANMNTAGFKSSRVTFGDVLSSSLTSGTSHSQIGRGVLLSAVTPDFTQGSFETTGNALDMAIDGDGFFIVSDNSGTYYTRVGNFTLDKDGNLVNTDGLIVQGYQYTVLGQPTGVVDNINVSAVSSSTQATVNMSISANIDSRTTARDVSGSLTNQIPASPFVSTGSDAISCDLTSDVNSLTLNVYDSTGVLVSTGNLGNYTAGSTASYTWAGGTVGDTYTYEFVGGFDASLPNDTSNFSSAVTVYDSLGNSRVITAYFTKIASGEWTWDAVVDSSDSASGNTEVQASGRMSFDSTGGLTTPSTVSGSFNFGGGAALNQDVTVRYVNFTQYASASETIFQSQDGYSAGSLQSLSISQDGIISGIFSNGQIKPLARLALARFTAPTKLTKFGRNLYAEAFDSGQALIGGAGQAGLGRVMSNSLELSNVDLAKEFVSMISAQRGFQANSRVISTTDTLLQELVNLVR